ncbi:hypothetical protein C5167_032812 [Papaver somniferum]|uniref:Uncharacterized protein n=1 Tax=Papaver somniferum TaxID=3469 RepID=A0A4Y7K9Z2_PAPSO|nr:hypothetical protein C5167_032812 [Papaver somniferum]
MVMQSRKGWKKDKGWNVRWNGDKVLKDRFPNSGMGQDLVIISGDSGGGIWLSHATRGYNKAQTARVPGAILTQDNLVKGFGEAHLFLARVLIVIPIPLVSIVLMNGAGNDPHKVSNMMEEDAPILKVGISRGDYLNFCIQYTG